MNKYYKIYRNIIRNAKRLNRKKGTEEYYEMHHIVPSSLNGSNKSHNKVLLTAREHFVVHACLPRFLKGTAKHKMTYGFDMMCKSSSKQKRYINSRLFEENKKKLSVIMSESQKGENHWSYGLGIGEHPLCGTKHSDKTKEKISNSLKGRTFSVEHKKNLSLCRLGPKNHRFGKISSKKTRGLISEANSNRTFILKDEKTIRVKNIELIGFLFDGWKIYHPSKGKVPQKLICPKCGVEGDISNMKTYHFDNCGKEKPLGKCPHCGKTGVLRNLKRWHFNNCKEK